MARTMNKTKRTELTPDFAALFGICIALGGILSGLILEGGRITDVTQSTAALIVLGGTFGAVLLTTPLPMVWSAARRLKTVLFEEKHSTADMVEEILVYAGKARK